jgi:FlaA1/EpsC-like NDP-sugar epimerase
VTHPDIIRYFMTIPEAARLVLQAAAIGESGQVLVLDMGEPVRIVDLARTMIRLAGRSEKEIGIVFTGLRAGEKLYEELLADADAALPTPIQRIHLARLHGGEERVASLLDWAKRDNVRNDGEVRLKLAACVPEYREAPAAMGG